MSVKSPGGIDSSVAQTWTADQTISKDTPALILRDSGGGVNEKEWRVRVGVGSFLISLDTDAGNVNENAIAITRSGAASASLTAAIPAVSLGTAAGTMGFFGVTPQVQPAAATQATITATWVAISSGFGFFSSDQAVSMIAAVKQIQFCLKTLGLWKGGA